MNRGFIKLYRCLVDWEWYKDIPVRVLFEHCLIKANIKDKKWQGIIIKKGSFVTSLDNLAFETGLTKMQVRTAIKKLKSTGELTHKTTSRYSIITINNWDKFHADNTRNNTQITHEQHTDNTQITPTKECKEYKNIKNNNISLLQNPDLMFDKNVNKVFEIYKLNCPSLIPIKFEYRDLSLRSVIKDFLIFIDFDFDYFSELCQKANKQLFLLDNKIDIESLIKNHKRIYSEFFSANNNAQNKNKNTLFKAELKAISDKYRAMEAKEKDS